MIPLLLLLILACVPVHAGVTEIASGSMLGQRFKPDRFYLRTSRHGEWKLTYSEGRYRGKARGKLMMLRAAQGLFADEHTPPPGFNADHNTNELIAALDLYKEHGLLGISVSLQGAEAGYAKTSGDGSGSGASVGAEQKRPLVSAFLPDGSLKRDWMDRLERLLTAADKRNMVVCLIYFDPGQDQVFESDEAIITAAHNITDWLIAKDFRNVVIDVANEWDLNNGDDWEHGRFIPENIAGLVNEVRERFHDAAFTLPIGASTSGVMTYPASLAQWCDVVLIHGDGRSPQEKVALIQPLKETPRPVWMIEDDNGLKSTKENLSREEASLEAVFQATAGWGYMPWSQAEQYPFEYLPGPSSEFADEMPPQERDAAYFRAVLENIARLVLKKPPSTVAKKKKG